MKTTLASGLLMLTALLYGSEIFIGLRPKSADATTIILNAARSPRVR